MTDQEFIGGAVERRRRDLNLSQSGFASLAEVSRGTIRNIERGVVDPNPLTWAAIESILGWAPGSLERLQEQDEPVPVLPDEPLSFILDQIIESEEADPFAKGHGTARFKLIMSSANPDGLLPDNQITELTDLVFNFDAPEEETEQVIGQIERFQAARKRSDPKAAGRPKKVLPVLALAPGMTIQHESFGFGTVLDYVEAGPKSAATVDFGEKAGIKRLLLRYAPIKVVPTQPRVRMPTAGDRVFHTHMGFGSLLGLDNEYAVVEFEFDGEPDVQRVPLDDITVIDKEDETMDQVNSSASGGERLGLSDEVMALLSKGQVIDYDIFEPKDTENIAVVSLLVRKSNAPLGYKDRKYFSDIWNILATLLHVKDAENEEGTEKDTPVDDPWATTKGRKPPIQQPAPPPDLEDPPF